MLFQLLFGYGRMQTYTVHEGPQHPTDRIDRAEALAFVKDGFSFQALLLGPIWLLVHRLWLGFAGYAAVAIAILAANQWFALPPLSTFVAFLGLHVIIGFEADTIERQALESKGWTSLGSVSGTSALDCERRFFETWLHNQPVLVTRDSAQRPVSTGILTAPSATTSAATARGAVAGRLAALWSRT
jgi:Protein of unknown function (DUF2628)